MPPIRVEKNRTGWSSIRMERAKSGKKTEKTSFSSVLERTREENIRGELNELLLQIENEGEKLKKNMTWQNFNKFKKVISRFLRLLSKEFWRIKKEEIWTRDGGYRSYQLVDLVEKEVEELRDLILQENRDNLAIIDKIEGISGLLFELYR